MTTKTCNKAWAYAKDVIHRGAQTAKRHAAKVTALGVGLYVGINNAFAQAAIDTDLAEAIDSAELTFAAVKAFVVVMLVFWIGWRIVKRVK